MPILKLSLSIGLANSTKKDEIHLDEDEWSACETAEEREKLIDAYAREWASNYIDIGVAVVED